MRHLGLPPVLRAKLLSLDLCNFSIDIGAYTSQKDLGMPESGIEVIVDQINNTSYGNPRKMNGGALTKLLQDVWSGEPLKYDPDQKPLHRRMLTEILPT